MNMKKVLALALALVLIVGATVAGTVAWLMDKTEKVTNTFTVGDINIDLKEHELLEDGTLGSTEVTFVDTYKILPGTSQLKDPFVTVEAKSEDCYVFVQVKEVNNTASADPALKYVEWAIDDAVWTELGTPVNGVYTYYATANYATQDANETYNVLKGTTVSYDSTLTAEQLETAETAKPQLIFKAFAVQVEAGDVYEAWDAVNTTEKLS